MSRRRPLSDIEELLDRVTDELDEGLGSDLGLREVPVDVLDRGDAFLVRVEVPGFTEEDIHVELRDNRLLVEGERATEEAEGDLTGRYIRRERRTESVNRTITLPEEVDAEAVSASLREGLLEVTLPKAADVGEGHTIDID
ncbi:MAG: Hsp20/alpha crystallin family protein [Halobacteriaceae archaeon]